MSEENENQEPTLVEEEPVEENSGEMTLLDHLEELRGVLLRALGALFVGCIVAAIGYTWIADILSWPLLKAIETSGVDPQYAQLINRNVFSPFSILFRVLLLGGLVLALPFMVFFVVQFIQPGLTRKEKAVLLPTCLASTGLFLTGAAFCFYMILPATIRVSFFFAEQLNLSTMLDASTYYGLVFWMMIGVGLCFEFPLGLVVLQYLGILTPKQLGDQWRIALISVIVAAAIIIPGGDPITLALLATPLFVLYLAAIFVGKWLLKKKHAAEEEE